MKSITDSVLFIVLNPTEVDYLSSQSLEELQRLRHLHPQSPAEGNLKGAGLLQSPGSNSSLKAY